jgi:hypothetical protein
MAKKKIKNFIIIFGSMPTAKITGAVHMYNWHADVHIY